MAKRRNPVIRTATILRKGGVHQKTTSANRQQTRQQLDDDILDYLDERQAKQSASNHRKHDKKGDRGEPSPRRFTRPRHTPDSLQSACH